MERYAEGNGTTSSAYLSLILRASAFPNQPGKDSRFRLSEATWGGLPDGHVLGKPVPLFPRIETAPAEK